MVLLRWQLKLVVYSFRRRVAIGLPIVGSVRRTNRLVVAHEAVRHGGFGAELAALVQEAAFDDLETPIVVPQSVSAPAPLRLVAALRPILAEAVTPA